MVSETPDISSDLKISIDSSLMMLNSNHFCAPKPYAKLAKLYTVRSLSPAWVIFRQSRDFTIKASSANLLGGNMNTSVTSSLMEREQVLSMQGCDSLQRVELLRRQYLQMLEPDKLALPNSEELILPHTQAYIFATMFNSESVSFVPSVRYQFRVLKKIIAALEKSIVDPEEDVCLPLPCSLLGENASSNAFFGRISHPSSLLTHRVMNFRRYQTA